MTDGHELKFWDRFSFSEDAILTYADSHSQIYNPKVIKGITEIDNYDAHHDSYQTPKDVVKRGIVDCSSWATYACMQGIKVTTFYPKWGSYLPETTKPKVNQVIHIDRQKPVKQIYDRIFVCRSGAWTPTWIEDKFWDFIDRCPARRKVQIAMSKRQYNQKEVDTYLEQNKKLLESLKNKLAPIGKNCY